MAIARGDAPARGFIPVATPAWPRSREHASTTRLTTRRSRVSGAETTQGWQSAPTALLALHLEFAGQLPESSAVPARLQAARHVPESPGFCVTNPVAEPPSAPISSTGSKASQTKPAGHVAVVESVIQNWVQ